jgi:hypothetical protein
LLWHESYELAIWFWITNIIDYALLSALRILHLNPEINPLYWWSTVLRLESEIIGLKYYI